MKIFIKKMMMNNKIDLKIYNKMIFLRFLYTMNKNRMNYKHFIVPVYVYTLHVNYLEYKKLNKIE